MVYLSSGFLQAMNTLAVQIVRNVDGSFPGWVECEFIDADGRRHIFKEKVPVVTAAPVDNASTFPVPGGIGCEVLARYRDETGKEVARITTERPRAIESTERQTELIVPSSLLTSNRE